jgi:DNA-binding beta-propeller fold protein YncE
VWDEHRQLIYLSMASASTANASTIGVLDPVSGTFVTHVPAGGNPGRLAISGDGQYLYVALNELGEIRRLALPSLDLDLTIPLGTRFDGAVFGARELHVSPADPRTIAVVRSGSDSPWDMAIFDDAVMRQQVVGGSHGPSPSTIQWDTTHRIFGVDSNTSSGSAQQIAVDPDGARISASQQGITSFDGEARLVGGRMYMERGRVFDPVTFAQLGSFPLGAGSSGGGFAVDSGSGRAFVVTNAAIRSFDLETFAPIASSWLPRASPTSGRTRLIRWGLDGLAVLNYESPTFGARRLLLLDGPFVRP